MHALLRWALWLLPADRREWGEALLAETADLPAGRARTGWLAGGLRLVVLEAEFARRCVATVAALGAGALLLWLNWHPGSTNPAAPIDRIIFGLVTATLVALPWLVRPVFGPVADNRIARLVRRGGYLGLFALLGVVVAVSRYASSRFDHFQAFDQENWSNDMRTGAVVGGVGILLLVAGYGVSLLALTARRRPVPAATLAVGALVGVGTAVLMYALMPFGNPVPGLSAGVRSAATAAAIIVATLGSLLAGALAGRIAGRRTGLAEHGLGQGALGGLVGLLLGPLIGLVLGAATGGVTGGGGAAAGDAANRSTMDDWSGSMATRHSIVD